MRDKRVNRRMKSMRRSDVNDMETKIAVNNEETVDNSVFKKGSVQKCLFVFGRKGEDPCRPEQAGVAEEPERKVWAKENEDTRQSALTSDSKPSYICWCEVALTWDVRDRKVGVRLLLRGT